MPLIKNPALKVGKLMVCAVFELEYISKMASPADTIRSFWENSVVTICSRSDGRTINSRKPFILFSATTRPLTRHIGIYKAAHENPSYGKDLKKYIEDNGLGLVTESEERQNATSNWLKLFIWHIDWDKLQTMMKPLDAEEYKQVQAELLEKAKQTKQPEAKSPSGMVEVLNQTLSEWWITGPFTSNSPGTSNR